MNSLCISLLRGILVLWLLVSCFTESKAQCNPPDQLPTPDCEDAPLVCLLNACYETLNQPNPGWDGFCGPNTQVHNPQFFQFIPTEPDVEIHIYVESCDSGNGLQSALIGACPWDIGDVIDCPDMPLGTPPGSTMILIGTGLTPGQPYWLLIDGSNGATCNYVINFVQGIEEPGLDDEVTEGEAIPESVCQGYNSVTLSASPQVGNAHGYYWLVEWEDDTITSTLPETTIEIPEDLDPGIYEICVAAFSGCDTQDMEICFDIEVYEIPEEEREPESFCPEDFPVYWGALTISGPGEYEQSYEDPDGCIYDSLWMVDEYPEPDLGELDTLHCEESLIYEDEFYDEGGIYDLFYPDGGLNGCDSSAELYVTLAYIEAFIELSCDGGNFVLTPYIQELIPFSADIAWEWYDAGTLIFDNIPFVTTVPGCYDLFATVMTNAGDCTFLIDNFCFTANGIQPEAPFLGFTDTLLCAQSGVIFEVIEDPLGEPLFYTWSVTPPTIPVFQDGSNQAEFDFSNSGPAEVCVFATNSCGDGPATCFMVDIKPAPLAAFNFTAQVCADSLTTITFTGNASPDAQVDWNFDNPTTVNGSGLGPYMVGWAVPGDKTISLTVIEPGCDTSMISDTISVSSFIAPVINCSSTVTSVYFSWDDVAGASGYLVSINNAPNIPIDTSGWLVSPLQPGTEVTLTLTVISAGPCDDIILNDTCNAVDCPPPSVAISGQDSACLNNPNVIDLNVLVNGSPDSAGTWAGPGIIDAGLGWFDPKVAGAGLHPVTFTVIVNNCPFTEPYSITVFDSLTADFIIDPVICISDQATVTYTGNASGTATYNYEFAPATVVSGSGSGPYELSWTSPGPQTVRLQVSENGCNSDIISLNTNVIAELNPPVVNCAPNTSGMIFSWTIDPAASGHDANTLSGQLGSLSGNTLEFTGLLPGEIVTIEIVTMSGGPCPERRDTFFCEARACPMPVINITPVLDICLYPSTIPIDLEVVVTGGTGTGTGDWSGSGITDAVNGIFDPVIAGAGSHLITFHFLDDGCDFFESITINVNNPPGAFISNTDLVLTCTSGSLFLDGSGSSGGSLTYQWNTSDGVILSGGLTAIAEVGTPGHYQLLVTGTPSGCKDSTSVEVLQDASIPVADAGPDKTITCDSTQFTLGGNSSSGPNLIYIWSTLNGNIQGATNGKQIMADKTGQYDLVVRDTTNGCQASDRVEIFIDTAIASIVLTPGNTIDCNTPISTITSTLNEPETDYYYSWSTLDGTIEGSANAPDVDVSQAGTYTLTIEHKMNGCTNTDQTTVAESDEIIDDVDVRVMHIVCNGQDNGVLVIEGVTGGTPPYMYQWSVSQGGGDSLSSLPPGQYSLTVSDANGCSFTESYTLTEPDKVTLDIGPNLTVPVGDTVTLQISTNLVNEAIDTIDWGGYDGIFCPGCPVFQFEATHSATVTAMISDMAGCSAFDSMRLTVIVPRIIYIPNIFSPNGDGNNDYFTISGRRNLINIGYLRIFDRWGNQLFENKDLTPGVEEEGWDGNFRDEPVQSGVYVYVARLDYEDGISQTVTGEVTVLR